MNNLRSNGKILAMINYGPFLWAVLLVFISFSDAAAQLSISSPASATKIKSCDDFATNVLFDPWDMSNSADVNRYFPDADVVGYTSLGISSGKFTGTTTGSGSSFYLFSPMASGSYPVGGRWGVNDSTINTSNGDIVYFDSTAAAKYKNFSIRMYTDTVDPFGLRMIWDRDKNYSGSRTITSSTAIPTRTGWNTYSVDLSGISLDAATVQTGWTSGSITGFAVIPTTQSSANIQVDWIRLEDPTSCATSTVNYTATTQGNNNRFSLWLDDDSNPFNGYVQQLVSSSSASGAGSTSVSSLATFPGTYYVVGLLDSDFRTLSATDPWDMSESTDVLVSAGVSGGTFSSGLYSGTTSSSEPTIYMRIGSGGVNVSTYKNLSLRITRSTTTTPIRIICPGGAFRDFYPADNVGDDVYQVDLSSVSCTGTISEFIIRPALESGVSFNIDFVSLRASGFDTSRSASALASSVTSAGGTIIVNSAPIIDIIEPSHKGGVAVRPWNMNTGDMVLFENQLNGTDSAYPNESYVSFLPDVRSVQGVRGDLFKGTSDADAISPEDPINYTTFPYVDNPLSFSASEYKNLCFKLFIDRAFDLGLGSVARVLWKSTDEGFEGSEDIVLLYDGWTGIRFHEYCVDLTQLWLDGTTSGNWNGTIEAFRVDSHEFFEQTSFYYDYIKLRKDDASSSGKFAIIYQLTDSDDAATADIYYTTASTATGGTLITTLTESNQSYLWDTSGIASGTYNIYAVTSDGTNTVTRLARGPVVISNGGTGVAPVLSLEAPSAAVPVCDTLQVKGYTLQSDRYEDVAAVEVFVDSALVDSFQPTSYSLAAVAAYPSADSSNTGFNNSYDFSGYSNGAHTVLIKAISSDGEVTSSSVSVTKQSSGCADLLSDPDPSGTPVGVDIPVSTTPSISSAKHKADGTVTLTVANANESGSECALSVKAGSSAESLTELTPTFTPSASTIKLVAKKVKIKKSKLKNVYFSVTKSCSGMSSVSSNTRTMKARTALGTKSISKVISKLNTNLAAQ